MADVSLEKIMMYISFLYQEGKSPNTIGTYVAALSYYFKMQSLLDLTDNFLVKKILKGAKRLSAGPDIRRPITVSVLTNIIQALNHVTESFYQRKLFEAMFSLAFHAFLRIGELTSRSDNNPNLLQFNDIELTRSKTGKTNIVICMANFKHNASKQPVYLEIQRQSVSIICPVRKLREYISLRGSTNGPLFCYRDYKPIPRSEFCAVLNEALSFAKYDTQIYKCHSFRIGAATTAHMMGIPDNRIKAMGRWHSDSFMRYIRIPLLPGLNI